MSIDPLRKPRSGFVERILSRLTWRMAPVGIFAAAILWFFWLALVRTPQLQAEHMVERLKDRSAAWKFAAMCIEDGRKPTVCMEACEVSDWPQACRAWIMDRGQR